MALEQKNMLLWFIGQTIALSLGQFQCSKADPQTLLVSLVPVHRQYEEQVGCCWKGYFPQAASLEPFDCWIALSCTTGRYAAAHQPVATTAMFHLAISTRSAQEVL